MKIPLKIGTIHFIGMGGIGMSGIAEILHGLGYTVQGSDMSENANVIRLRNLGIKVSVGHDAENLKDAEMVVISSAIPDKNPELSEARKQGLPVVARAEMLAELMRLRWSVVVAGTHGKTTTTSIAATLLEAGGLEPTIVSGGIINSLGTNAKLGKGDWMVVESDESDGSFVKLPATIGIVTNIDPEHLEAYGSYEELKEYFLTFVQKIPFYGFACLCIDHPVVQSMLSKIKDRRIITYGMSSLADIRAVNIQTDTSHCTFDVEASDKVTNGPFVIKKVQLPMLGHHNIQNALASLTAAHEIGVTHENIKNALEGFGGIKRRFTKVGEVNGVTIIDDYGHHPVEIEATLKAAHDASKENKVIAVFQPHRYSRVKDLFDDFCKCFNRADIVIVSDIYAASETPIKGITRETIIEGLKAHGHRNVLALTDPAELASIVQKHASSGDFVVCLGAGTISNWANDLPKQLENTAAA